MAINMPDGHDTGNVLAICTLIVVILAVLFFAKYGVIK